MADTPPEDRLLTNAFKEERLTRFLPAETFVATVWAADPRRVRRLIHRFGKCPERHN